MNPPHRNPAPRPAMSPRFTVTPAAAAQIKRSAEEASGEPLLRVAAKRAADGSVEYGMGFDDLRDQDAQIECEGVRILIGPLSRELLDGATLDFVELEPGEYQFIFVNPNEATRPDAA